MWRTYKSNLKTSCSWEPIELRILKEELKNLECCCSLCEPYNELPETDEIKVKQQNDAIIQTDIKTFSIGSFSPNVQLTATSFYENILNHRTPGLFNSKCDFYCPNCILFSGLVGGMIKVLKDEESETKRDTYATDKFTEVNVHCIDKTTSILEFKDTHLNLHVISSSLSDTMVALKKSRTKHDRVTFLDAYLQDREEHNPEPIFAIENFVDSIRPSLKF